MACPGSTISELEGLDAVENVTPMAEPAKIRIDEHQRDGHNTPCTLQGGLMNRPGMSTALLAFAVVLAPASPASAQVRLGLHVGAGPATFSGEGVQGLTHVSGGISLDFPASGGLGLRTGGFYVGRGARFDALPWSAVQAEQRSGGIADARLYMDYVEFPALLRLGSAVRYVMIGPVIGTRINCSVGAEELQLERGVRRKCHRDFDASFRSRDVGVRVGLGTSFYERPDGSFATVQVLYTRGLVAAFENADPVEGKHSGLIVHLGITIPPFSYFY